MDRPEAQAPLPAQKPTMGAALCLVCFAQWVGCLPTLVLCFFALRLLAWGAWGQWGVEIAFVLLSCATLCGWLLCKALHLVLLAQRKPKYMKIYHSGVIFGAAGAASTIVAFLLIIESDWPVIWLALLIPLALSALVTLYYAKSKRLAAFMLGSDYMGESPLVSMTRRARTRQLENMREE